MDTESRERGSVQPTLRLRDGKEPRTDKQREIVNALLDHGERVTGRTEGEWFDNLMDAVLSDLGEESNRRAYISQLYGEFVVEEWGDTADDTDTIMGKDVDRRSFVEGVRFAREMEDMGLDELFGT